MPKLKTIRTELATLEQLLYDSTGSSLRILHAPIKRKLPTGECITAEIRWVAAKEILNNIYKNLRTKDYLRPDAEKIISSDIWTGLEPSTDPDAWILRIVLLTPAVMPQPVVTETKACPN